MIYFVNAMIDRGFLGLLISRHKRLKTEMGKWGGGGGWGCLGVQSFCETSLEIRSGWGELFG